MAKMLDVYFHQKIIGHLEQDDHGDMNFTYSTKWLEDSHAKSISCSLPLREESFKRKECQAFFGGMLPEEHQRKLIANILGISANNDFSMLEKIGGECAGALSFMPAGKKLHSTENSYRELSNKELHHLLKELPLRPLLVGEEGIRLSLAGVQDKLAVCIQENKMFMPLYNAPSTHILKPDFTVYKNVIFNEAFCLHLAKQIGLSTAEVEIKKIEEINYLLVKRYDRVVKNNKIERIHQEDFCQALGILSTNKYQNEGGPSLKQCFDLIRKVSSRPVIDLDKMINAVIFNFLIGNCDAHGKNFSLLYQDSLQLAPLYDLISTMYYNDLSKKMAMKLGGEYAVHAVTIKNFDKLAEEVGFAKPQLRKRIIDLIEKILYSITIIEKINETQEKVANLIQTRCNHFLNS